MAHSTPFKRLILRLVLRNVSPMVIRLVSVSDHMELTEFHEVFSAILSWSGNLDYIFPSHGQEFNSFQRVTRSKTLQDFQLHRQEKFLYVCDALDNVRVLDIQAGEPGDHRGVGCGRAGGHLVHGSRPITSDVTRAVRIRGPAILPRPARPGGVKPAALMPPSSP